MRALMRSWGGAVAAGPVIEAVKAGTTGQNDLGSATFDLTGPGGVAATSGLVRFSAPEGQNWIAEFRVDEAMQPASGFMGAADETWWNGAKAYNQTEGNGGWWYSGSGSSYGEANGTAASFNGNGYVTPPAVNDVIGLVWNEANGKLNIYRNGTRVVTLSLGVTTKVKPVIGYWASRMKGEFLAGPSAYHASYVYPS